MFTLKLPKLTGTPETDKALTAFNNIMAVETFSLLDDKKQSSLRYDLNLYEIYNTRLLRVETRQKVQARLYTYPQLISSTSIHVQHKIMSPLST
jgi:hypothetical protein